MHFVNSLFPPTGGAFGSGLNSFDFPAQTSFARATARLFSATVDVIQRGASLGVNEFKYKPNPYPFFDLYPFTHCILQMSV